MAELAQTEADACRRPTRTFEQSIRHVEDLGFLPSLCIDVGAANGTGAIYEAFPDAFHIVFEPLSDFHEALAKRLARFQLAIHRCALMDRDGAMEILRTEHNLHGSSPMHLRSDTDDPRLLKVPARRLNDIMQNRQVEDPFLLKTDCQGSDLMILNGAPQTLKKCKIVFSNVRRFGSGAITSRTCAKWTAENGFVIYDILDAIFRPFDDALGQLDVVFGKVDGFLRASRKW